MVGESPDEKSMKPTILVICAEAKMKDIESGLVGFIKISIPSMVEFKVTAGTVKLAAGETSDSPLTHSAEGMKIVVKLRDDLEAASMMGVVAFMQAEHLNEAYFPACTLGGIISVGGIIYALTVAHSTFRTVTGADTRYTGHALKSCGQMESYEWSGNEESEYASGSNNTPLHPTQHIPAADWMLIRLQEEFVLPNLFKIFDSEFPYEVSGYFRNSELLDDEVWVCGGITGTQIGILNTTPSSILYGQVLYDVLFIALEFPLGI
jgi:hypothetical protein